MEDDRCQSAELVAEALAAVGARTVFALPGSHVAGVLNACRRVGLRVVHVRHEENAVMMAEGWALATGETGFAIVTAGPGLANALGGIAEANAAGAPVVVLAGRTAVARRGFGAVQDLDQLSLVTPVTKWRQECLAADRVADYVREAARQAAWGSPGVAYLEVPEDVLATLAARAPLAPLGQPPRSVPPSTDLDWLRGELISADRPIVVAGSGAFFSGADKALRDFIERTGIPVTTTSAARGLVDDDHELCLGSLVHGGVALAGASLALVLGSRFNANLMYGRPPLFADDQVAIQLDSRAENLGGARNPTRGLVGDVAATLQTIADSWDQPPSRWSEWGQQARSAAAASRRMWEDESEERTERLHPGVIAREAARVFDLQGPTGTWISDGGDSVPWGIAFSRAHRPGSNMLIGSAMGTLGVGLPFAIGAGLARPGEPLLLFSGDGAFGFSAMELQTAATQGVGLVVVVVNNGVWRGPGTVPAQVGAEVDHGALATSLGGWGTRVSTQAALGPALEQAFARVHDGVPCVVDVEADGRVVSRLLRGLDEIGLM